MHPSKLPIPPRIFQLVDEAYAAFEIGGQKRAHRINRDICLTLSDEGISPVDFWLRFKEAAEIIGASHK